jgi:hypothetical protein
MSSDFIRFHHNLMNIHVCIYVWMSDCWKWMRKSC